MRGDDRLEDTIPLGLCHIGVCDEGHEGGGFCQKRPGG